MFLPIGILLAISNTGCFPVLDGDRILGRHLAEVDRIYSAVPPDEVVGLSPSPGIRRTIPPSTLRKLLQSHGIEDLQVQPVCVEWPMRVLKKEELQAAIGQALGTTTLAIEIQDFTAAEVPAGQIVFARNGISSEDAIMTTGATWRGDIMLSGDRRFRIWSRVKISGTSPRMVAAADLTAGKTLSAGDLKMVAVAALPAGPGEFSAATEATGLRLRRSIRQGELVRRSDLEAPSAVVRGEMLQVRLERGPVRFRTVGRAAMAGRTGEWITLENPETGRKYRGLIQGPGKVEIP